MTFLNGFHTVSDNTVSISAAQASHFAKSIADDFNPLHDEDAKRFCVPGDLLFSLVLSKFGLSQSMSFSFAGMVGADTRLVFDCENNAEALSISDVAGKHYLDVERGGAVLKQQAVIDSFIREYVAFSGKNFPHILVPLMRDHNVMINPARPLVIYESMSFDLQQLDFVDPVLSLSEAKLAVNGKRGDVSLHFTIEADGKIVGKGLKTLVLSGLRAFEESQMQGICDYYAERKNAFSA